MFVDNDDSDDGLTQLQTYQSFMNNLEDSISLVERTAKKLHPIFQELQRRAVQTSKEMLNDNSYGDLLFARDEEISDNESPAKNRKSRDKLNSEKIRDQKSAGSSFVSKMLDMRHILGFLN